MYCTNCGKRLNSGDLYCTSCGFKNNYQNNNDDDNYLLLLIISILFPIVGIIFYIVYRKKYKKSINYLISSLVVIAVKIIVILMLGCFNLLVFDDWGHDIIDDIDDYKDSDDEDYVDDFKDILEFNYSLSDYVELAKKKFKSDNVDNKCYDIDSLENSLKYDGSIEISNIEDELVIMVWFTDGKYYVDSLNYDNYGIDKIEEGNLINKTCSMDNFSNSL